MIDFILIVLLALVLSFCYWIIGLVIMAKNGDMVHMWAGVILMNLFVLILLLL